MQMEDDDGGIERACYGVANGNGVEGACERVHVNSKHLNGTSVGGVIFSASQGRMKRTNGKRARWWRSANQRRDASTRTDSFKMLGLLYKSAFDESWTLEHISHCRFQFVSRLHLSLGFYFSKLYFDFFFIGYRYTVSRNIVPIMFISQNGKWGKGKPNTVMAA